MELSASLYIYLSTFVNQYCVSLDLYFFFSRYTFIVFCRQTGYIRTASAAHSLGQFLDFPFEQ